MTDAQMALRELIGRSKKTTRQWAEEVARVNERSVRRWIRGDVRIPGWILFDLEAAGLIQRDRAE